MVPSTSAWQKHFLINTIYEEGELSPEATVKKYLTVRQEGNRMEVVIETQV